MGRRARGRGPIAPRAALFGSGRGGRCLRQPIHGRGLDGYRAALQRARHRDQPFARVRGGCGCQACDAAGFAQAEPEHDPVHPGSAPAHHRALQPIAHRAHRARGRDCSRRRATRAAPRRPGLVRHAPLTACACAQRKLARTARGFLVRPRCRSGREGTGARSAHRIPRRAALDAHSYAH